MIQLQLDLRGFPFKDILKKYEPCGFFPLQGDFLQTATGRIQLQLGGATPGTEHDQVYIVGDAELDGAIEVSLVDDFALTEGDAFTILHATGAITGQFAGLADGALVGEFGDTGLRIQYSEHDISLVAVSPTVIPDLNSDNQIDRTDASLFVRGFGLTDGAAFADGAVTGDGAVIVSTLPMLFTLNTNSSAGKTAFSHLE